MIKKGDIMYNKFEDLLGLVVDVSDNDNIKIVVLRDDRSFFLEKGEVVKLDKAGFVNKTYRNSIRNTIVKDYLDGVGSLEGLFRKFKNFR